MGLSLRASSTLVTASCTPGHCAGSQPQMLAVGLQAFDWQRVRHRRVGVLDCPNATSASKACSTATRQMGRAWASARRAEAVRATPLAIDDAVGQGGPVQGQSQRGVHGRLHGRAVSLVAVGNPGQVQPGEQREIRAWRRARVSVRTGPGRKTPPRCTPRSSARWCRPRPALPERHGRGDALILEWRRSTPVRRHAGCAAMGGTADSAQGLVDPLHARTPACGSGPRTAPAPAMDLPVLSAPFQGQDGGGHASRALQATQGLGV